MEKISKMAEELIDRLFEKGADKDSVIATMLGLSENKERAEENYAAALKWITEHPEATEEEIYLQMEEIDL